MYRIGVMDSGCGGLSVLRELRALLPGAGYLYYADSGNCPYGEKSPEFITERCRSVCRSFVERGARLIVIACNTATSAAIATLRREFDVPFVGMEPAIKPAALGTRTGVVGVLATAGTLGGDKYLEMKKLWGKDTEIAESVGKNFVELVESGRLCGEEAYGICRKSLLPLLEKGADTIVLGCTHYPFLLPVMKEIASAEGHGETVFIDPAPAVAARVLDLVGDEAGTLGKGCGEVVLESSGDPSVLERLFGEYCSLPSEKK